MEILKHRLNKYLDTKRLDSRLHGNDGNQIFLDSNLNFAKVSGNKFNRRKKSGLR